MTMIHKAEETTTPDSAASLDTRPRLLVVDDISDNRYILARRFMRRGFDVVEADNGYRALELMQSQPFDAVLLDVMMPGIDGIEVLTRIRQTFSPVELPIIMVTAKTQSEDIVAALDLKANDYVVKPVDFSVAFARVNVQIERKRANDALKHANLVLEERVVERTSRLVEINMKLKGEIEQRQRSEAETRYLAFHDALTGLANRLLFREDLENALNRLDGPEDGIAVLFIDLDGFKSVNDTLGHTIGDLLLKAVAIDFRDALEDTDRIARLGGDEFAILHHCKRGTDSAMRLAAKLIDIASRQRVIEAQMITVGASIGVVTSSNNDDEPEDLLKNADLAMYRAKSDGRGTYRIFDPEMDAKAQARRVLELDMRNAFVHGQYEVYYQPLISVKSNRVCGFEALVRWNHPELGVMSPADFIPVAEETGLILQLGDWVLRQACMEAARWPVDIRIAVNISPIQFMRGNVAASVVSALAASGLQPQRLEVEITESVLFENTEKNMETLGQLRELGVRVAMDDFGTGYSSLGYLRRFRFDKIKIDQSFIRDVVQNHESEAIVHAIANLGISFGIATTAEGVETYEQLMHLAGEGCAEVQGWIFSKAIPASRIPDVLAVMPGAALGDWSSGIFPDLPKVV